MSVISRLEKELKKVYLLEARQEERRKRLVLKAEKIKIKKRKRIERQKRLKSLPIKDIRLTHAYRKYGQALCLKCHRKKHPELPDCFFYKRFGIKSVVKKPTSVILEA